MAEPPSWEPILSKEEGRGGNLQEYIAAKVEGVNGIEMGVEGSGGGRGLVGEVIFWHSLSN